MLKRYGWSEALQHQFESYAAAEGENARGLIPARVIIQRRGHYQVMTDAGELNATLAGKLARDAEDGGYPVTGDWVALTARPEEGSATIHHVLPRSSVFKRRASGPGMPQGQVAAANIDVVLLTASLNADLNVRRIERYLATALESGARPVIVLTKADTCENAQVLKAEVEAVAAGAPVHAISSVTGEGLGALRACLAPGQTAVLLGSSGVGKSTLVNALAGVQRMETQAIREDDARGRHTTTHRELVLLPSGALILDTPGMREFGLWDADSGVAEAFAEIEDLAVQCKFRDCGHSNEPGCAVQAALAGGALDASRWEAYGKLQTELAFQHRKENVQARLLNKKVWASRQKEGRARARDRRGEE